MDVAILAAARFPISEPFAGGMEVHTFLLADHLARRGHDVTVYAAGGAGRFAVRPMLPMDFDASPWRAATSRPAHTTGWPSTTATWRRWSRWRRRAMRSCTSTPSITSRSPAPACSSTVVGDVALPADTMAGVGPAVPARSDRPPHLASVSRTNAAAWGTMAIDRIIGNGVDLATWLPARAATPPCGPGGSSRRRRHTSPSTPPAAGRELRLLGPVHDVGYFHDEIEPRLGTDAAYLGHANVARGRGDRRRVGGGDRDTDVGRAVRARRGRGHGVRHAGRRAGSGRAGRARGRRGRRARRRSGIAGDVIELAATPIGPPAASAAPRRPSPPR